MHGDLGATVEHRPLHLLDEHALAADRVQRHVVGLRAVAERLDQHELGVEPGGTQARQRRARTEPSPERLPRVAMRIVVTSAPSRSAEVEQVGDGGGVALAARRPGLLA